MKTILLTKGQVAFVDDEDFDAVNVYKWHAVPKRRRFYAARKFIDQEGRKVTQYLHHFLLPGVARVDHRDGNGCNDQKGNLRPATNQQNCQGFRQPKVGASSKFRGVTWHRQRGKWAAQLCCGGKHISLGLFTSEVEAAKAYDKGALKYFGEFACPNFP